jgi:hypothetical protein
MLVAILASTTLWAYDFSVNGIYYNIIASTGTAEVTYCDNTYNSYSGRIVIPSTVKNDNKTYRVTSIGDNAFRGSTELTAVVIGSNVKSLGKRAFLGCTQLTQAGITASVEQIGDYAFAQCTSLQTATMLNREPIEIGAGAFMDCSALTSVKWVSTNALDGHGGLQSLGTNAFARCTSLISIVLPGPLQHIGTTIFNGCTNLNTVTVMKEQPLSLKGDPFALNPSQVTIEVPSSGTPGATAALYQNAIGWKNYTINELPYSFIDNDYYTYLKTSSSTVALSGRTLTADDVVVRKSIIGYNGESYNVTSIAPEAFKGSSIKTLETGIALKLKSIGTEAFAGCTQLSSISLIEGINNMGERAFAGCTALTSLQVPSTLRVIPRGAFENCSALNDLRLLLGLSTISENAFAHCSSLKTLSLPRSTTLVEPHAFANNTSLKSITVDPQCTQYASFEGVLFECKAGEGFQEEELGEMNMLVLYPMCKTSENFYIPCGVTKIDENSLEGASHLKHLAIPATTHYFGSDCFLNSGIETINYRNSEPSDEETAGITTSLKANTTLQVPIGATAAYEELTSWNDFKAIVERNDVFYDSKFTYDWNDQHEATIVSIKTAAVDNSGTLTIPAIVKMSQYSYFITELRNTSTEQLGTLVKNLIIASDSLSIIDTSNDINPLAALPAMQSMSVSDGNPYFYVEDGTIYNSFNDNLYHTLYYYLHSNTNQDFTIPASTKYIISQAFAGNTHLKNITLNTSLKSIEAKAFEGCTALQKIINAENVAHLKERAFAQCTALTTFLGGERLNTIGDEAFLNCNKLKYFPFCHTMLQSVGKRAFKGCSSIKGAVFGITLSSVGDGAFEDCSELNNVFFTYGLSSMGNQVFKGCDALSELWLCNTDVPDVTNDFFSPEALSNLKLFVPQGSEASYQTTAPWSQAAQVNTCSYLDNGADVNSDKSINALDITILMSYLLGDNIGNVIVGHLDVNHDGAINAADITAIYNYILSGIEIMMAYKFVDFDGNNINQNISLSDSHLKIRAINLQNDQYVTTGLLGYIDNNNVATFTPGTSQNIQHLEIVPITTGYCCMVAIVSDGSVCHYRTFPFLIKQ